MRRPFVLLPLLLAACVAPETVPDGRGAVSPGQRLVVAVYPAPGPWIVADPDSKVESAAKVLPIGLLMQTMQEDRILELSKEIQPYLPRPRYERLFEAAFAAELKTLHDGPVQTWSEAGLPPEARREFNRAEDALDWRRKYFEPRGGAPRDYSRFLSLDDAVMLDINLQYGTDLTPEEGRLLPTLTVAMRAYRPSTGKLLWTRVEAAGDQSSTRTLPEFRAEPKELTDRLQALAPVLAQQAARAAARGMGLNPPAAPAAPALVTAEPPLSPTPLAEASSAAPAAPPAEATPASSFEPAASSTPAAPTNEPAPTAAPAEAAPASSTSTAPAAP